MSHNFPENIFMSPFPRFEIPKMSDFQSNTDSPSIIFHGEYLLHVESSLHPAPISLWLDFRYKEKKKSDGSWRNGSNNTHNSNSDSRLFCFAVRLHVQVQAQALYFCQKLFSPHLSRNYRYNKNKYDVFHNTESARTFCTEIFPVNYVLTPTDSRVRQNEFRIVQMASDKYLTIHQYEESSLPVPVLVHAFFMPRLLHAVSENQNFGISTLTSLINNQIIIGNILQYKYKNWWY